MINRTQIIYIVILLTIINSCNTLNTNLSIKENKIPASFNTSTDTTTIAKINWRQYFADELLVKLIDTALASNFDLQIALQRIQIARSGVRFQTGELFPKVDGNVSIGSTRYGEYTESGQGNATTPYPGDPNRIIPNPVQDYYLGLTATWEIDIWGKLRNQRKSTISNYLASIEGKNFVVSNLVADIAITYYELVALDNELEIIQQTVLRQQEALEIIKTQKETGKANELAVQQFQSQLLNLKANENETLQQISEAENKINFLVGRFPQAIQRNKKVLFQEMPQQISSGIPVQMLTQRPDIREAEYQVEATKFDLKTAKASFFPNINIVSSLGFQSFNSQFLFNPVSSGYNALGGLVSPLLNRNALKMQFATAKASQLTAMYNYQKTILNGFVEVANELSRIDNLKVINSYKKAQNDLLSLSVETSTELYKTGKANYLEVLLAQQNLLETQLELINVNKRQRISIVNVYKSLGGGWR
jgi:NodT family efflux transporter outer membrane factor (OMF) lipoprotein